jgi:hypothetical protein
MFDFGKKPLAIFAVQNQPMFHAPSNASGCAKET